MHDRHLLRSVAPLATFLTDHTTVRVQRWRSVALCWEMSVVIAGQRVPIRQSPLICAEGLTRNCAPGSWVPNRAKWVAPHPERSATIWMLPDLLEFSFSATEARHTFTTTLPVRAERRIAGGPCDSLAKRCLACGAKSTCGKCCGRSRSLSKIMQIVTLAVRNDVALSLSKRRSLFASARILFLWNLIVLLDADAQSSVCCWSTALGQCRSSFTVTQKMSLITDFDLSDTF